MSIKVAARLPAYPDTGTGLVQAPGLLDSTIDIAKQSPSNVAGSYVKSMLLGLPSAPLYRGLIDRAMNTGPLKPWSFDESQVKLPWHNIKLPQRNIRPSVAQTLSRARRLGPLLAKQKTMKGAGGVLRDIVAPKRRVKLPPVTRAERLRRLISKTKRNASKAGRGVKGTASGASRVGSRVLKKSITVPVNTYRTGSRSLLTDFFGPKESGSKPAGVASILAALLSGIVARRRTMRDEFQKTRERIDSLQ